MNFYTVLGLIFLVLKLCGLIEWPWVWVVSPFWIIPAIYSIGFIFHIVKVYLFSTAEQRKQMKRIKVEMQKHRTGIVIVVCLSLLLGSCTVSKPGIRCPEITKGSFKK